MSKREKLNIPQLKRMATLRLNRGSERQNRLLHQTGLTETANPQSITTIFSHFLCAQPAFLHKM